MYFPKKKWLIFFLIGVFKVTELVFLAPRVKKNDPNSRLPSKGISNSGANLKGCLVWDEIPYQTNPFKE